MRRRVSAVLATSLIVCVFPLVSCKHEQPKLTPVVVNEAFEHLLYIGLYVAKDKGFFEQQGLDVKIETGGGDAPAANRRRMQEASRATT